MSLEVKIPSPGESISEVQLTTWLVNDGDFIEKDQEIAEIDSDKATLSIAAEESGKIKLKAEAGQTLAVGTVIAEIDTSVQEIAKKEKSKASIPVPSLDKKANISPETAGSNNDTSRTASKSGHAEKESGTETVDLKLSPLARKLMQDKNIPASELIEFFKGIRIGRKDVDFLLANRHEKPSHMAQESWGGSRETNRKKMSMLRTKLSQRLVSVKNETAMLTTFNEVNMTPVMEIRRKYKDSFREKHGVSLGFMSFFTKAVTIALHTVPEVNAQIDGDEIVYFNYADIGIAVSSPKGLMVPVLRNAERMSLAEIESNIKILAEKARTNKISIDEMTGGTFTITNGGVFGSMLSTPILNPPQSAILGMHNIVERPLAINGKMEIHPVMYLALSYDHRIIDGRESVTFLVHVKNMLENPVRLLFGGREPEEVLLQL